MSGSRVSPFRISIAFLVCAAMNRPHGDQAQLSQLYSLLEADMVGSHELGVPVITLGE